MTEWLKSEILPLTADPTDKFCELEEIRHPDLYEEGKQSLEGNTEQSEVPLRRSPRKSVTSDETPGSSQYLSSRVGSNSKDASGELEDRVSELEKDKASNSKTEQVVEKADRTGQLAKKKEERRLIRYLKLSRARQSVNKMLKPL
ncbi:hypothetical protein DPMN_002952 [Dreissena polymorpha]|uniref:Uncharacterized protein n=1 Tax=Dreissena polymorpha TaxID=45954 RepID=A0A9D4MMJ9_DREPO|nr:hypothetical protein DPMN_162366 [Dreissena polymorpha]KAH3879051.1 hypothetical protein DPMN_002952 [Dreissena polymorpha]